MELKIDKKTGLKYREDSLDNMTIKEERDYKAIFPYCKDAIVFDVGANIGMFTYHALKEGAKQVISYEPEPDNFYILTQQDFDNRAILNNVGLGGENGELPFYRNTKGNKKKPNYGKHSLCPTRGREVIKVEIKEFYKELDKYKPTVLKMDCEGGEFFVDWSKLPNYVEYIIIEIHKCINEEKSNEVLKWYDSEFDTIYSYNDIAYGRELTYIRCGKRKIHN